VDDKYLDERDFRNRHFCPLHNRLLQEYAGNFLDFDELHIEVTNKIITKKKIIFNIHFDPQLLGYLPALH